MWVSVSEDNGWDDLERGPNIQRNGAFLIIQSHDFMTERPAHLLLTLKQVMGMLPFFQPCSTPVLPYIVYHIYTYVLAFFTLEGQSESQTKRLDIMPKPHGSQLNYFALSH